MLSVSLAPKPHLLGVPDLPQVGNHWVAHAGQNRERPQATESQKHQQDNCRAMETQVEPSQCGEEPRARTVAAVQREPRTLMGLPITHGFPAPSSCLSFLIWGKLTSPSNAQSSILRRVTQSRLGWG
jgi:hypothetical protein